MSYILEALKKSDQERNRGTTPGLQTVQATPAPASRKRPWWMYLLIFALLLNAGVILYWLQPWSTGESDLPATPAQTKTDNKKLTLAENHAGDKLGSSQSEQSQSIPQTAKEISTSSPQAGTEPGPKDSSSPSKNPNANPTQNQLAKKSVLTPANARPTRETKESPAADLKKPVAKPPKSADAKRVERPVETQGTKSSPSAKPKNDKSSGTIKAADSISIEKLAELNSKVLDKALMTKQAPTREDTMPKPAPDKPKVPGFRSLPIEIQQEIPDLKLSFLVYSKNPQDRMVSINGEMKREGQEVEPGLKLEEITPEGAIFSYKNHRFQKGVF